MMIFNIASEASMVSSFLKGFGYTRIPSLSSSMIPKSLLISRIRVSETEHAPVCLFKSDLGKNPKAAEQEHNDRTGDFHFDLVNRKERYKNIVSYLTER